MDDNYANEIRLIANEIMRQLYEGGYRYQLHLLKRYAEVAIEHIDNKPKQPDRPKQIDAGAVADETAKCGDR